MSAWILRDDPGAHHRCQWLRITSGATRVFERLEPRLDLGTLIGKEAILERRQIDGRRWPRLARNVRGGCMRLIGALARCAEHRPVHVETNAALDPAEDRCAGADLDVVGMRAKAEDGKRARLMPASPRSFTRPSSSTLSEPFAETPMSSRQGIVPCSTMSSSTCLSFSVSIGRQKPSCLKARSWSASISRRKGASTSSSPSRI